MGNKQSTVVGISELAPRIAADGRPLPCAALARLVREGKLVRSQIAPNTARALCLAAYQVRFAELVLEGDRCCHYPAVTDKSKDLRLVARSTVVSMSELRLVATTTGMDFRPMPDLARYLEWVPLELAQRMLIWAPPVISTNRQKDGRFGVVANVLPILIANQVKPDLTFQAKRHTGRDPPPRSLQQLAWAAIAGFSGLVSRHREIVVRAAPSLETAQLLSALSRSHCAELRKRGLILT